MPAAGARAGDTSAGRDVPAAGAGVGHADAQRAELEMTKIEGQIKEIEDKLRFLGPKMEEALKNVVESASANRPDLLETYQGVLKSLQADKAALQKKEQTLQDRLKFLDSMSRVYCFVVVRLCL